MACRGDRSIYLPRRASAKRRASPGAGRKHAFQRTAASRAAALVGVSDGKLSIGTGRGSYTHHDVAVTLLNPLGRCEVRVAVPISVPRSTVEVYSEPPCSRFTESAYTLNRTVPAISHGYHDPPDPRQPLSPVPSPVSRKLARPPQPSRRRGTRAPRADASRHTPPEHGRRNPSAA